jgi:gas vesicle protein
MAQQENGGFSAGTVLLSFFIGGMVGAGVALLAAPMAGKETREKIKELMDEAKEKAEAYVEQIKETASSVVEKGKELIEEQKTVITTAVEAGKDAYEKEKKKVVVK